MRSRSEVLAEPSTPTSGTPLPELARAITAGAVRLAAATAAWLALVAEFDVRGGWHGWGIKSCAHWLSWQCGLAPGPAREHVRVARALRSLPRIEAAFTAGQLSYSKVRALTRIAAPDCEQALLDLALVSTAAQLDRVAREWRRADTADDTPPDPPEARQSFQHWWDDDGMLNVQMRMAAVPGAEFMTAIDSLAEREARRERAQKKKAQARGGAAPAGLTWQEQQELDRRCADDDEAAGLARERTAGRRLHAVASLAQARVQLDRRPGDPPRREVVVHVDSDVLADDAAAGRAYIEGGPALTAAQARRMLCEAKVLTMLERGREPLALGRTRRRASRAQRRALLRRDGGCARPGCPETRIERLHAHHLRHWLFGGRTDLDNLVLLCDADHGLTHDLDLVMARVGGRLIVTTPDGRHVWGTADAAFVTGLTDPADRPEGLADVAGTASTGATHNRPTTADPFTGVHPIDTEVGRRPAGTASGTTEEDTGTSRRRRSRGDGRPGERTRRGSSRPAGRRATDGSSAPIRPGTAPLRRRTGVATPDANRIGPVPGPHDRPIGATLFPSGEPPLPDALPTGGERMDLRYVVDVLMGNRDLIRRLAAEAGAPMST